MRRALLLAVGLSFVGLLVMLSDPWRRAPDRVGMSVAVAKDAAAAILKDGRLHGGRLAGSWVEMIERGMELPYGIRMYTTHTEPPVMHTDWTVESNRKEMEEEVESHSDFVYGGAGLRVPREGEEGAGKVILLRSKVPVDGVHYVVAALDGGVRMVDAGELTRETGVSAWARGRFRWIWWWG